MKRANVRIETGKPLQFLDVEDVAAPTTPGLERAVRIGETLKARNEASVALLKGKYAAFSRVAPPHLRSRCNIFLIQCTDGVFVRYDLPADGEPTKRAADVDETLSQLPASLSDYVLRLGDPSEPIDSTELAPTFTLETTDASGRVVDAETRRFVIRAGTRLPDTVAGPKPPGRPICLVSIFNEGEFWIHGRITPTNGPPWMDGSDADHFIARSRICLPVGWQAIEVYPLVADEYWQPQYSPLWAELDILAAAAARNLQDSRLSSIDGLATARTRYAHLLDEFESLLQGPEEPVHQFLKQHPELVSPTHEKFWSKLPFGDRVSDFVFRDPGNDYLVVEIEAPYRELFRRDGQQRQELTHAINQIADWIQYIEDNKKKVEQDLGLAGISTNPRSLVVIGRSQALTDENRRKLTTLTNQNPKLRIATYDDILAGARANLERIFGPLGVVPGPNVEVYFFKQPAVEP